MTHPHDLHHLLDTLLRKRFRDLAGEYETLADGGRAMLATDRAEELRRELVDIADRLDGKGL